MLELLTIPQKGGFPNPLPFQYRVILYANTKKPKSFLYTLSYFEVLSFHGKNHRPRKFKMNKTKRVFCFVAVLVMIGSCAAMAYADISLKAICR